MNPVYCQPFRRVQLAVYQDHLLSRVARFVYVGTAKMRLVTGLMQHRRGSADVRGAGPQRQLSAGQHHSDLTGITCSRGTGMDTETFMAACCILLRLSPTFVLNSLYLDGRHLQDRELSVCYLLPAITAQVSKTRKSICGCYIYVCYICI